MERQSEERRAKSCSAFGQRCVRSILYANEATDESPSAAELADRQHELVAAFFQGKVDGIIFWVDDAEEAWIAETLGASATVKNPAVKEHADVVAVADFEFFHLLAIGINCGTSIEHLSTRLGIEAFREVPLKRNSRMRRLAVTIENYKTWRLSLYILPLDGSTLRRRERMFEIARERIVRWRNAPLGQSVGRHWWKVPLPRRVGHGT